MFLIHRLIPEIKQSWRINMAFILTAEQIQKFVRFASKMASIQNILGQRKMKPLADIPALVPV